MLPYGNLIRMGRKKKYKAPQGLVKMPGSPFWWIVWKDIRKSTGIPLADLTKATILLLGGPEEMVRKQDKVKEILGQSIPFSKLIERYLAEISPGKKSSRSDKTNSNYPLKYFGTRPIDGIKPQDIYKYFEWRREQKSEQTKKSVSGPTMNREKSLISDAFSKAIRWGYVEGNPVAQVEGFHENKRDRYITDKEFEAIKKEARSIPNAHHLSDIMDALYHTGQRSGKIFGLRWSQVDLKERKITFGESTSTKRVPDEIWINQPLFELLSRLKAVRGLQKVVGPYVFQKRDGKPYRITQDHLEDLLRKGRGPGRSDSRHPAQSSNRHGEEGILTSGNCQGRRPYPNINHDEIYSFEGRGYKGGFGEFRPKIKIILQKYFKNSSTDYVNQPKLLIFGAHGRS